jgi:hypothetical protein
MLREGSHTRENRSKKEVKKANMVDVTSYMKINIKFLKLLKSP